MGGHTTLQLPLPGFLDLSSTDLPWATFFVTFDGVAQFFVGMTNNERPMVPNGIVTQPYLELLQTTKLDPFLKMSILVLTRRPWFTHPPARRWFDLAQPHATINNGLVGKAKITKQRGSSFLAIDLLVNLIFLRRESMLIQLFRWTLIMRLIPTHTAIR